MARSELSSEFKNIKKDAIKQGWDVKQTSSLHWKFVPPDPSQGIVFYSGSSSDHRAIKNFTSEMRSKGLRSRKKK